MSGMGQMGNMPPGGYPNNTMSGNMGSGVQSNNNILGNTNNTNGQGNTSADSLPTTASDASGANNTSHVSGSNNPMLNRMTTSSMGGMGGGMMNNSPYGQTANPASMSARSQAGDQTGYNQGGDVPSGSDKNVLSLLLNKPSVRPQMNMNRALRPPNTQVTVHLLWTFNGPKLYSKYRDFIICELNTMYIFHWDHFHNE